MLPKVHPSIAQAVAGGDLFAIRGGFFRCRFFAVGGGFFRAGVLCSESKTAACRSLPMLELSPWLRGKPVAW
jgi:hypothetical protein